jgi:hypothetical protein
LVAPFWERIYNNIGWNFCKGKILYV